MRRFLIFLAVIVLFGLGSTARAVDIVREQSQALGIDELEASLPREADELLGGLRVSDAASGSNAIERLISGAAARLREIVKPALANAATILAAAVLSGMLAPMFEQKNANYARLAGVLAISSVSVAGVNAFIAMAATTLDDLSVFAKMLLPCLSAAAAAGGAVTSAAAKYSATVLFLNAAMGVTRAAVMPLIYAYAAVSVAEAAVGGDMLSGIASLLKWLTKTILTVLVTAFVLYLTLTGVVAGSTDATALRAAKLTVSTVLPVVGSILADAAETVLSGAVLLRNSVGVFGVLGVAAICLIPFLKLGMNYLLYRLVGGLSGAVADSSISRLIDAFGAAYAMTLAMAGVQAVMLFVAIVSTIRAIT